MKYFVDQEGGKLMLHMASKPMVRVQCDQEIGLKPFDNPAQPGLRIAFCFPEGADGLAGIFRNLQGGIGEMSEIEAGSVAPGSHFHLLSTHSG